MKWLTLILILIAGVRMKELCNVRHFKKKLLALSHVQGISIKFAKCFIFHFCVPPWFFAYYDWHFQFRIRNLHIFFLFPANQRCFMIYIKWVFEIVNVQNAIRIIYHVRHRRRQCIDVFNTYIDVWRYV